MLLPHLAADRNGEKSVGKQVFDHQQAGGTTARGHWGFGAAERLVEEAARFERNERRSDFERGRLRRQHSRQLGYVYLFGAFT